MADMNSAALCVPKPFLLSGPLPACPCLSFPMCGGRAVIPHLPICSFLIPLPRAFPGCTLKQHWVKIHWGGICSFNCWSELTWWVFARSEKHPHPNRGGSTGVKDDEMWAGWDRDLGAAGSGRGLQSVVPADPSCLVQMPPCSSNILPRFAPSILLNLHTRSSLQMAAPTSFQAAAG